MQASDIFVIGNASKNDLRALDLASECASWSKDRATRTGAFLQAAGKEPLSFAYNGFCRGVNDHAEERHARPQKYLWTEHAERNALWNFARRQLRLGSASALRVYLNHHPTPDAARAILQSGVTEIILPASAAAGHSAAGDMLADSQQDVVRQMLDEGGVEVALLADGASSKWGRRMIAIAEKVGAWGKCGHSHGAVLLDADSNPISFGYEGLPRGLDDEDPTWLPAGARELVEDAPQNAILNAIRPHLAGATLYATHHPCLRCTRAIIQAGIAEVVSSADTLNEDFLSRWSDDIELSLRAFAAAGVAARIVKPR